VHPVSGKMVKQMLAELKQGVQGMVRFVQPCEAGMVEPAKEEVKKNVSNNG